eukprot:10808.XXX_484253_483687_1 [CDS] Oithona nana genome sequencing.
MLIIVSSTTLAGILSSAFVNDLVSFYATRLIGFLRPSIMAIARSLLAQSVNGPDEIGRIFAVTAFISAILPFVSNPSFRFLFDLTAKVFPQAILIMTSGILFMTVVFNLYLFCSRNNAMK